MERARLRPVPHRPSGPVEPAEALAHVEARLPDLDAAARQALALVELAGRTRPQLVAETAIDPAELAAALARARKALRRAAFPLPGSGWCERAERLLSDELDGELAEPGPRRLAAHLANCDRCVEHERRLWQARDQLVASFDEARAAAEHARAAPTAAEPVAAETPAAETPAPTPFPQRGDEPDTEAPEMPERGIPEPEPPAEPEPPPAAALAAVPALGLRLVDPAPAAPDEVPGPAEPEPAEPEPADPEPVASGPLAGVAWTALLVLAVLLAVASIAITAFAIAGGGL
jgi:hypothetical protein